jgi:hypothetical protein
VFVAERVAEGEGGEPGPGTAPARAEGGREAAPPGPRWVARKVPVRVVGTGSGGRAAIEAELDTGLLGAGARVVVLGQQALSDGAPIVLCEPATGGAPAGEVLAPSVTSDSDRTGKETRS